jgi:hypothetical protein
VDEGILGAKTGPNKAVKVGHVGAFAKLFRRTGWTKVVTGRRKDANTVAEEGLM